MRYLVSFVAMLIVGTTASTPALADPQVRMRTDFGDFFIELTPDVAPLTVANFLTYVNSGAYDNSFFHRNPRAGGDPNARFVLQGGEAFWPPGAASYSNIPENAPVPNEFNRSNTRGTVALAKLGGDPDSGTNNFFINLVNNGANLDNQNGGFTVFGVINADGMNIIDEIAALRVANTTEFTDIPISDPAATQFTRDVVVLINEATEFEAVSAPAAAILPASRAVAVGATATGFATLINTGSSAAASCRIRPATPIAASFTYRQADPATNEAFGANDPVIDVPGGGAASFVFSMTPNAEFTSTDVIFDFRCGNGDAPAQSIAGVNTFALSASTVAGADVVALAATTTSDGINDIPAAIGSGAFAVGTFNVGAEERITVSADDGGSELPVVLFVCETDAAGSCLEGPALSVASTLTNGATKTFAVFAQLNDAGSSVEFDPAGNRAFVRFRNDSGELRGGTSVALRTVP